MPLNIEQLEACVTAAVEATSAADSLGRLTSVLNVLSSPEELGRSFGRGTDTANARDYSSLFAAFKRLFFEPELVGGTGRRAHSLCGAQRFYGLWWWSS